MKNKSFGRLMKIYEMIKLLWVYACKSFCFANVPVYRQLHRQARCSVNGRTRSTDIVSRGTLMSPAWILLTNGSLAAKQWWGTLRSTCVFVAVHRAMHRKKRPLVKQTLPAGAPNLNLICFAFILHSVEMNRKRF